MKYTRKDTLETYKNEEGKLHREDGPAVIHYFANGDMSYEQYFFIWHRI
jgi:hypothetical protein